MGDCAVTDLLACGQEDLIVSANDLSCVVNDWTHSSKLPPPEESLAKGFVEQGSVHGFFHLCSHVKQAIGATIVSSRFRQAFIVEDVARTNHRNLAYMWGSRAQDTTGQNRQLLDAKRHT